MVSSFFLPELFPTYHTYMSTIPTSQGPLVACGPGEMGEDRGDVSFLVLIPSLKSSKSPSAKGEENSVPAVPAVPAVSHLRM